MDNSNRNSLTRSTTSSQNDLQAVIQKYGSGYRDFLSKYPTLRNRQELISSAYEAVSQGGMSLAQIDRYFTKGASEWWIKYMLIELFTFLGAIESVTSFQIKGMAARIRHEYYHLTPSELTYFFYSFSMGDYGKLYSGRNVNPQDILIGLKTYMSELFEKRVEYDNHQKQIQQEKDDEKARREAIPFDEYRKLKGLPGSYGNPLEQITKIGKAADINEKSTKIENP